MKQSCAPDDFVSIGKNDIYMSKYVQKILNYECPIYFFQMTDYKDGCLNEK